MSDKDCPKLRLAWFEKPETCNKVGNTHPGEFRKLGLDQLQLAERNKERGHHE